MAGKQTLIMYKNISIQRQRQNIWTPYVIRSPMVPSFCRLELPQPSYCSIKNHSFHEMHFCTKFYKCFILKIPACIIMLGFRKSGHIYPRFFGSLYKISVSSWHCHFIMLCVESYSNCKRFLVSCECESENVQSSSESSWYEKASSSRLLATGYLLLYLK